MGKFKLSTFLITVIFLCAQYTFAETNPYSYSFSDIERSEAEFIDTLQIEQRKQKEQERFEQEKQLELLQRQEEARLQKEMEQKKQLEIQRKKQLAAQKIKEEKASELQKQNEISIAVTDDSVTAPSSDTRYEVIITAKINISDQKVEIFKAHELLYTWKVSTARRGYRTPRGTFQPLWTSKMHYSKKYDNSPMPYSVFFHEGYAMHGTSYVHRLGTPASHGCVRLHTSNAKTFYELVREYGKENTHIIIED